MTPLGRVRRGARPIMTRIRRPVSACVDPSVTQGVATYPPPAASVVVHREPAGEESPELYPVIGVERFDQARFVVHVFCEGFVDARAARVGEPDDAPAA